MWNRRKEEEFVPKPASVPADLVRARKGGNSHVDTSWPA